MSLAEDDLHRAVGFAHRQAATRLRNVEFALAIPTPHQVCAELWLLEVRMPLPDVIAVCRALNLPLAGIAADPTEETLELPPEPR
jgi:hypothetical protein